MPTPILPRPSPLPLGGLAVGRPVSAAHGRRACQDISWLLACAVEEIADCDLSYDTGTTTPLTVSLLATRSPGVSCWLVGVDLMEADAATATITITVNGGTAAFAMATELDGSAALGCPAANTSRQPTRWAVLDVTGLAADGTVHLVQITYVRTSNAKGMRRVYLRGVPQALVDPVSDPTTEVGINASWPYPRRGQRDGLIDGAANEAQGFLRLEAELERARTLVKLHRQWATYEDDTYAAQTSSTTFGPLTWRSDSWGAGDDPILPTRARRYYRTSVGVPVPEQTRAWIRYKCGGTGGTVRFKINGVDYDKDVVAAASWTTLSLTDVLLPTDLAGQRVQIQVHGRVLTTGVLRLAAWDLPTNES